MMYDDRVKTVFQAALSRAPYSGLCIDIVEDEYWLIVRLYRDNFESYTTEQRFALGMWVTELLSQINQIVPCYLEVEAHAPRLRLGS